jgi:recombination protein RecA
MSDQDIIKQYGEVLQSAASIIDNPPPVISVSPKIDLALGGGVPEGCLFILTGQEKIGKTILALQFCRNAQKVLLEDGSIRKSYFANVEGRIKKRDLEGIFGLDLSEEHFKLIGSTMGKILSGEDYLGIISDAIHHTPHSVCVIDSFSALSSKQELSNEMEDVEVAGINRVLSRFTRKVSNVLPINRVTLVGITHLMANIQKFGAGRAKVEKSGTSLKYAQDVKLWGTHFKPLKKGETIIGQHIFWNIENSAIGPPGGKVESTVKFGRGIWNEYEVASMGKDFGIIEGSSWFTLPNVEKKIQGLGGVAEYLEANPNAYEDLKKQVYEMLGI